ncbi:uncharacterized protein METZ01_LOCUS30387 [marine metagenome]|uniref:Uncharacterized protein n=1 Tax=marine metagenome TaxID=408172 RepID=A0A381QIS0_9ZZZZ
MICRKLMQTVLAMKTVPQENVAASEIDRTLLLMIT